MSQDIMLMVVMMVAFCGFLIGSSVSVGLVGYNEGWFGPSATSLEGQNCRDVWMKECEGIRGKERDTCIQDSKIRCIMSGGLYTPPESLKSTAFPMDCNAGARQECAGKGQKCIDEYKAACIANGGRWTTASGEVQAICGLTKLKNPKNGLPCPTNEACLLIPECRAACPCGHTYAVLDSDREYCVYLYLHNDGVNDHVEGPLKICSPTTGETTVDLSTFRNPKSTISYDKKVSSIRVGKYVGVRLYKDNGLPLVFPVGGEGHQNLMNLVDYCGTPVAGKCDSESEWNDAVRRVAIGRSISR